MPCDSVTLNPVNMGAMDSVVLSQALKRAGIFFQGEGAVRWVYVEGRRYLLKDGSLSGRGYDQADIDSAASKIKQAYSGQVVLNTAAKFGWQVKQTAPNKFQVIRRA